MSKIAIFKTSLNITIDENLILLFTLSKYTTDIRLKTRKFREFFRKLHEFSPRKTRKMHFWQHFSTSKKIVFLNFSCVFGKNSTKSKNPRRNTFFLNFLNFFQTNKKNPYLSKMHFCMSSADYERF